MKEKELIEYEKQLREYEEALETQKKKLEQQQIQMTQYQNQMLAQDTKQNLIEWELDLRPELELIAHSLRCDVIKIDEDGNQYWIPNPDKSKVIFNEYAVNDLLRNIIILVNKNKLLSNYTIDEIKDRVRMIGHELRALIYVNYEVYGLDTDYKMNNFPFVVLGILDIIESAYRRALAGRTHDDLSKQRLVTQTEPLTHTPLVQPKKEFKFYNPLTWGG